MTALTTTAATPEELATITVRYRLPRSEAQAVMLDERARQISWDDVFAERDAQRAEIERLTADNAAKAIELKAANSKIERMRKAAEGTDQWANEVIAAICKHVGVDDGFTAADLASPLEEHNAEFDAIGARATTAEAALTAVTAERDRLQAKMPELARFRWNDEELRRQMEKADAMAAALADSQERERLMREALTRLETANDALCATRSDKTYASMLEDGASDALLALDDARREARAALQPQEATDER
jgi:hypothetical protein